METDARNRKRRVSTQGEKWLTIVDFAVNPVTMKKVMQGRSEAAGIRAMDFRNSVTCAGKEYRYRHSYDDFMA